MNDADIPVRLARRGRSSLVRHSGLDSFHPPAAMIRDERVAGRTSGSQKRLFRHTVNVNSACRWVGIRATVNASIDSLRRLYYYFWLPGRLAQR
jgi:hypothetical protein